MAKTIGSTKQLLKIEGLEECIANVEKLIDRTTGKRLKRLYVQAAAVVSDQARANIQALDVSPELKEVLTASVVTNAGDENKPNALSAVNQWAAMKKLGGKESGRRFPNPYWFEYGVAERTVKKTGKPSGSIRATPFFRPAVVAMRARVLEVLTAGFKEIVDIAAAAAAAGKNPIREFFDKPGQS